MTMEQIIARLRRALMLDPTVFEEVRDDATFTPIAAGLAAAAIIVAGFGAWLFGETVLDATPDGWFVDTLILGSVFTALLWVAAVATIYVVLTQVYRETAAPDALFRVCALGFLPFAMGVLVLIPEIGFAFGFMSAALTFYLTVFGLSAAFSIAQSRAVVAAALGFAVMAIVIPLISGFPDNNFVSGVFVY
ncbi:MAG: hypothetical protein HYY03_06155, partial [Chloroflexi bacterium]|nr:hypothetical protein [Chloroflexota bacterium]